MHALSGKELSKYLNSFFMAKKKKKSSVHKPILFIQFSADGDPGWFFYKSAMVNSAAVETHARVCGMC